jgi:hypothetical protein
MSFSSFLAFNPSCFLFVDPSINSTGYAVYKCRSVDPHGVAIKLVKYGLLKSAKPPADLQVKNCCRIRDFLQPLLGLCHEFKVKRCYVEEPGQSIYKSKKITKNMIIARARSVAMTMGACQAMVAYVGTEVPTSTFLPADWQPPHNTRKESSKEWSLRHANSILIVDGFPPELQTKADENIADAINFGYVILQKFRIGAITFY